jgi:hypothetical protein
MDAKHSKDRDMQHSADQRFATFQGMGLRW